MPSKDFIDAKYLAALQGTSPQVLIDCLAEGYSPFATMGVYPRRTAFDVAFENGNADAIKALASAAGGVNRLLKHPDTGIADSTWRRIAELKVSAKSAHRTIIELGVDVNRPYGRYGETPIHYAASEKNQRLVELLLKHGAAVDSKDKDDCTALMRLLAQGGHDEPANRVLRETIADLLIRSGADIAVTDKDGNTPLMKAASGELPGAVASVLKQGADLEARNRDGETALLAAARSHTSPVAAIKVLLKHGADVNAKDKSTRTALMLAADRKSTPIMKLLLDAGADINAKDKEGRSVLMRAVSDRALSVVKLCVQRGAEVDLQDRSGQTALMAAASCSKGQLPILQTLIDARASLGVLDADGYSALHRADPEAACLLLAAGAKPTSAEGASLLERAIAEDHLPLALLVVKAGSYALRPLKYVPKAHWPTRLAAFLENVARVDPALLLSMQGETEETNSIVEQVRQKHSVASGSTAGEATFEELPRELRPALQEPPSAKHRVMPGFWNPKIHPAPRLAGSGKSLPCGAVERLAQIMADSTLDSRSPAVDAIKTALDAKSLADFSWSVFLTWNDKGDKSSDWMLQALGYFGDDTCARKLVPFIRIWPKTRSTPQAKKGLEVLAAIGSDAALAQIQAIALGNRYRPVQEHAEAMIKAIAKSRGLTAPELDDRLVPDLGLASDGTLQLDFGARRFMASVDERLRPVLLDGNNIVIKDLPKPETGDDRAKAKQAAAAWADFRTELKAVGKLQLERLEHAMVHRRRWSGDEFKRLLVGHPLLSRLVRALVWARFKSKAKDEVTASFEVTPDGRFIDLDGAVVDIPQGASIGIAHPLHLGKDAARWKEQFAEAKRGQPFHQLVRKVYRREDDASKDLFGLRGARITSQALRGLKALGWSAVVSDGGWIESFDRTFRSGVVSLSAEPGIHISAPEYEGKEQTLTIGELPALTDLEFSELIRELQSLRK